MRPRTDHRRHLGWCLLAFLLPAALLTIAYAVEGFAPFGDRSILTYDMASQYVEFFCGLKNGDVFFSWSKALGSSYIGVFSYYVSSPLSLFTLLVPNACMPVGLMWLTVGKFGLCGLTGYLFFSRFLARQGAAPLLGGVCYAMCAYNVAFSMCIMWLDGVIWLPVILLGLEGLLAGRRRWLFPLALAVCFVSTWYISYMIGLFCCLWFVYWAFVLRLDRRQILARLGRFLLSAVWALCLTAWLWLPTLLAMFGGKFSIPLTDYSGLFTFDLLQLPAQLLPGQFQYLSRNLPFLFCGTLTVIGAAAWFFLRGTPLREKLAALALVLVLLLSLWLSPLDRVWHLFKYPNCFLHRYSFLLSFVLVLLAAQTLGRGLEAARARRPRLAKTAALALACVVCAELTYNAAATFRRIDETHGYESYSAYQRYYAENQALVDQARALSQDEGFYRMGATKDRGLNAPLSFGYHGVTHYSSFFDSQVNRALKALGFAQSWYWTAYYGSTPLTDALLSVRYVLSANPMPENYTRTGTQGELSLYENPSVLPLAFAAPARALELSPTGGDPFQNQNDLFAALTGREEALFTPVSPLSITDSGDGTVTLTFLGSGQPLYANLAVSGLTDLRVNGIYLTQLNTSETQCIHYLGTPAAGETLTATIRCSAAQDWSGRFYTMDSQLLQGGLAPLTGAAQPQVVGTRVSLTLTVEQGQAVVTTIPAEQGWQVTVDGEPVETGLFLGAFLALELEPGAHTVELSYTPPGLIPALGLLALALAGGAVSLFLGRRRGNKLSR